MRLFPNVDELSVSDVSSFQFNDNLFWDNNAFAKTMVIVIPVLVSILVLLTIVRCIFRQKRHRRAHLRELARIEAGNKMQTIIDDLTVIEVGKNDPPPSKFGIKLVANIF